MWIWVYCDNIFVFENCLKDETSLKIHLRAITSSYNTFTFYNLGSFSYSQFILQRHTAVFSRDFYPPQLWHLLLPLVAMVKSCFFMFNQFRNSCKSQTTLQIPADNKFLQKYIFRFTINFLVLLTVLLLPIFSF